MKMIRMMAVSTAKVLEINGNRTFPMLRSGSAICSLRVCDAFFSVCAAFCSDGLAVCGGSLGGSLGGSSLLCCCAAVDVWDCEVSGAFDWPAVSGEMVCASC